MKNKALKMELLNSEKMSCLTGGAQAGCTKKGDTIFKECIPGIGDVTVVLCVTYEANCQSGFSNSCGLGDINCPVKFTISS